MPRMGSVPPAREQPMEEHMSEFLGHASWMWTIDAIIKAKK